jgi:hypothetical protein
MSAKIYMHYKGGIYEMLHIAHHRDHDKSNDMSYAVVTYRALPSGRVYWAKHDEFFGEVPNVNGDIVPRFKFIGEAGR